ncbi:MAG: TRAP transporter large permease [Pseudorhodobacter sp.]
MTVLLIVVTLLILVLIGMPIALALGGTGLIVILASGLPLQAVPHLIYNSANAYALTAIPLFMLMGAIVERAGMGKHLIDFASALVGWMRGGLAHVNTLVSFLFAGMNGSAAADVASMGPILIPEMKRKGYPLNFAAAITSSTSDAAILIPPSIVLIVYGVLANVSITRMFLAGIIPGAILMLSYMALTHFFAVRHKWPVHEQFDIKHIAPATGRAGPALLIPFIIMGGILGGIFTATEAASIAVFAAIIIVLVFYRNVSLRDAREILLVTAKRTGMVMMIIAASGILAWFLSNRQIPQQLATALLQFTDNYYVITLIVCAFLIVLGTMINGVPAMIILVPVLLPIMTAIEMDPIHFGIIFALATTVGSQTPPVAATMLLTCAIAGISIAEMWRMNRWFILLNVLVMLVVATVPMFALWLPGKILD